MELTDTPKKLPPLNRRREGKGGIILDQIELRSGYFGALSLAQTVRKGKGRGRGKGKGSYPGGKAVENPRNPDDYIFNRKLEQKPVPCHFCNADNIEGTHKCQSCFRWLVGWTDGRIATEVCRLERTAKMNNGIFALDKIDFEKQPRAQRLSDRVKADQRRAGRSNFGNVRDAATTHAGRYAKLGFVSIRDRKLIAKCISPDFGRSRDARLKQLGTGVSTRLVFMPDYERDIRKPLDVTKEAVVAHYARFFPLAQFAVLATEILKARGEPQPLLFGWAGSMLPIDQPTAQDCFFDLVDFAKKQWNEQYHNVNGLNYSHEEEATASGQKSEVL
eukprot:s1992_g17.t1